MAPPRMRLVHTRSTPKEQATMTDPLAGIPLPATHITDDVAVVIEAAPAKVFWASLADKVDNATWEQLRAMARGGIGEPSAALHMVTDMLEQGEDG